MIPAERTRAVGNDAPTSIAAKGPNISDGG